MPDVPYSCKLVSSDHPDVGNGCISPAAAPSGNGVLTPALCAALPDAPSSTADVQSSSFGEELGHGALTIGKDELTFIKAPFQKKNLKWDALFVAAADATDCH